jgi:hypothetical protein
MIEMIERTPMVKPSRSIGVDDPTGQPNSAPDGPYITDRTDDSRQRKPWRNPGAGLLPNKARPQPHRDRPADLAGARKGPAPG